MTRDTIRRFNHDTFWLAAVVLGTVVFAALALAAREHQPKATEGGRDLLLNANPARVSGVVVIRSKPESEMSSESESSVDYELDLQENSSPRAEPTPSASAAVLAAPVELFRYRGAAEDGGTLEYVFEAGAQNSPNAITKEKAAEVAADFLTSFYHVQVGTMETQQFRTTPVPFWLVCFSDTVKGPIKNMFFVVLLPDGTVVVPKVEKRL